MKEILSVLFVIMCTIIVGCYGFTHNANKYCDGRCCKDKCGCCCEDVCCCNPGKCIIKEEDKGK